VTGGRVMSADPTPAPPGPDAILFDMDGTLLDSEKIWDIGLDALAAHLGGQLSPAARVAMLGSPIGLSVRLVHEDLGVDADPGESTAYLLDSVAAIFADDLHWRPGARELLTAVATAGVPTALVTSTVRRLTDVALDWMGRELFTVSVCGDETPTQKPTPAPYLRAAELLGLHPTRCLAVEDSPIGIASAEAAGVAVLAVPSEVHIEPGPKRILRDDLVGVDLDVLRTVYAQLHTPQP
jgi:HAD superfamily hydrolase (TIGR01509 family)